jgi:hypothetical protein
LRLAGGGTQRKLSDMQLTVDFTIDNSIRDVRLPADQWGQIDLVSQTHELSGMMGSERLTFLQWNALPIPAGADILESRLEFTSAGSHVLPFNLTLTADRDVGLAPLRLFSTISSNFDVGNFDFPMQILNVGPWGVGQRYVFPDISSVIRPYLTAAGKNILRKKIRKKSNRSKKGER